MPATRRATRRPFPLPANPALPFLLLFQVVFSDPRCGGTDTCVDYNETHFTVWYVWFSLLFLLIITLCCVIVVCLQCWLKRHRLASRRTLTIVALNDSDPVYVTDSSQSPFSAAPRHCQNPEPVSSHFADHPGALRMGEPPSYEDVVKISQF
ncbi:transmembrane protein 207 isoform X2 [Ambystoma mexicanum]|uniref:transmembrane protein 207 isoform X2 n=1 Tax=Ambystoma mexicanum TaxID=8296 RepID=UPI0037E93665